MKALLDTNIIIHRETNTVINEDIGILFRWLDQLKYDKCIHPLTVEEIKKYRTKILSDVFLIKMESYSILKTATPISQNVSDICNAFDKNNNDHNDTFLLNEVYHGRVDILITEDKKIHNKASALGISDNVFFIDSFIEKCLVENPAFIDYRIQSVKKVYFGNVDLGDSFFDSFKSDYMGFEKWFIKKSDETAYVCYDHSKLCAFLYLKFENHSENYADISPPFTPKRRMKIGTLKVTLNGYKIGERFIKIVIDNALRFNADEIYVTIFENSIEKKRLIRLLKEYGFEKHGIKSSVSGSEVVYTKSMFPHYIDYNPKLSYPYICINHNVFLVPIYPEYHTELLPDSILSNESPDQFSNHESYRNAISKVYISRSYNRNINSGDIIVFYRTGGYHKGVITTIGIVENIITNIPNAEDFIRLCRRRSVFTDKELYSHWSYSSYQHPFIVNFLYAYSFPHRVNLQRLIEIGVIADINSAPRGFTTISKKKFLEIIKETNTNENIIVN